MKSLQPHAEHSVWDPLNQLSFPSNHLKMATQQDNTFQHSIQDKHAGSIAVVNYKGGVRKTTATFFLGAQIANDEPKKKVLIVDIDAQCSLTSVFGVDPTLTDDHNILTLLSLPSKTCPIPRLSNYPLQRHCCVDSQLHCQSHFLFISLSHRTPFGDFTKIW
jgi:hypothetical protein